MSAARAPKSFGLSAPVHAYLCNNGIREPEILARLREETASHPRGMMQIPPEEGALMQMLVKLTGAKKCLEIGVFTGYSCLSVALALPEDGTITGCDVSEEYTDVAKRYLEEAGVANKVNIIIAPATETLASLVENGESKTYDFAFIDADKANMDIYYERCLELVKPGGLIVIDNVLWGGKVVDADNCAEDDRTRVIDALNRKVHGDDRVELCMLGISDGMSLCRVLG